MLRPSGPPGDVSAPSLVAVPFPAQGARPRSPRLPLALALSATGLILAAAVLGAFLLVHPSESTDDAGAPAAAPGRIRMDVHPEPASVGDVITVRLLVTNTGDEALRVESIDLLEERLSDGATSRLTIDDSTPGWRTRTVAPGQTAVVWELSYAMFASQVGAWQDKITAHTDHGDLAGSYRYQFER